MTTQPITPPLITLRIPGLWGNREEFENALPDGYSLHDDGERLLTPEGDIVFGVMPADDQLAQLMLDGFRREPSANDVEILRNHIVKVFISLEGGSVEAAGRLVRIGAALLRAAGGGGVFVDNSGLSHPSDDWLDLAEGVGDGGEYWAYVSTTRGRKELWTTGMHVLGHRDGLIARSDDEEFDSTMLHSFLEYAYCSGRTIHDGDVFGDPFTPWFRAHATENTRIPPGMAMHNPYGVWRLEMIEPGEDLTPISLRN